jgi:hypothetical protein
MTAGAVLLDELRAALARYVVMPSAEAADAVTLWIAATHAQPAWEAAPRLAIVSPEKRCGKSRLLDVIEATCHDPLITVNISPAALVRSIGDDPPVILLDEADTVFGPKAADQHEDLRGILNAGHARRRPYIRWDVAARAPERCPTFAMAALAGIGNMPDTIMDRSVVVRMRRRAPGETVAAYRERRDGPPLRELGARLGEWAASELDALRAAEPGMPVEDRAADTWEPLIAVADAAGEGWPELARSACAVLTAEADDTGQSLGVKLLADLREIFRDLDRLSSAAVVARLRELPESPWQSMKGQPLDQRGLARLLASYGVSSHVVRIGQGTPRGFLASDLADAWARYVPGQP